MTGNLSLIARILAVTLGSYGMTSLVTVALSLMLCTLGMNRVEAVTAATLSSFLIFAIAAMAAFHARHPAFAWGWLGAISALAGAIILISGGQP